MQKLTEYAKSMGMGYKKALKMAQDGHIPGCKKVGNRWMVEDSIDKAMETRVSISPSPRSIIQDITIAVGGQALRYAFLLQRRINDPEYANKLPFSGNDMRALESMASTLKKLNVENERLDRQDLLNGLPDSELKNMLNDFLVDNPGLLPSQPHHLDTLSHKVKRLEKKIIEIKDDE